MKPTKQHILDKALKLFNENGFVNVRLQNIADAAFVSVGHLAYHFKNKNAIVEALYDALRIEQIQILNEYKTVPLFEDINSLLIANFNLQSKYIFFYLDTLELWRANPEIGEKHAKHIEWQLAQFNLLIQFNIARGSLLPIGNEQLVQVTRQLRASIDMWQSSVKIEGNANSTVAQFLKAIWSLLLPYFTDMGHREYAQIQQF